MSSRHSPALIPLGNLDRPARFAPCPPITVRQVEPTDVSALHDLFATPEILHWTIEMPFTRQGQVQQRLAASEANVYQLVATLGTSLVGSVRLVPQSHPRLCHRASLGGMAVQPRPAGQGGVAQR